MSDPICAELSKIESMTDGYYGQRAVSALRAVLELCDQWDEFPGSSHGLKMGQMTHGCAAYWVRDAIAEALGVET